MADLTQAMRAPAPGMRAVVRPPARRSWWEWVDSIATGGLCLVVLAGALFWVWQHVHVLRQGYEIERLRERQVALVQEHKALRLEAGQLRQLRRVEEIARTRLGMVTPKPGQVILLSEAPIQ